MRNTELQHLNNGILNKKIIVEEVKKSKRVLKNGKACGCDNISNEMFKISAQFFIDEFAFLLDFILQKGFIWRENIIKSIYKGGRTYYPSNYRGIAVSSCFSKLLRRVLFDRLDCYIENNNLICPEQTGFRKDCRTSLTLKTLIDKAFKSKNIYSHALWGLVRPSIQSIELLCFIN